MQGIRDFKPHANGSERRAVSDAHFDAVTGLAVVRAIARSEFGSIETDARNLPAIQFRRKFVRPNPRRADILEWRVGASPNRNAALLQNLDPGIEECFFDRAEIRR